MLPVVQELQDVPALHGAPGIPLVKPQLDFPVATVLRPPAFDIEGVGGKELADTGVLLVQPHAKPLADFGLPVCFPCLFHGCILLLRMESKTRLWVD